MIKTAYLSHMLVLVFFSGISTFAFTSEEKADLFTFDDVKQQVDGILERSHAEKLDTDYLLQQLSDLRETWSDQHELTPRGYRAGGNPVTYYWLFYVMVDRLKPDRFESSSSYRHAILSLCGSGIDEAIQNDLQDCPVNFKIMRLLARKVLDKHLIHEVDLKEQDHGLIMQRAIRPFLQVMNSAHVLRDDEWRPRRRYRVPLFRDHDTETPALMTPRPLRKEDLEEPGIRKAYEEHLARSFEAAIGNMLQRELWRFRFDSNSHSVTLVEYFCHSDAPLAEFRALLEEFPELQEFGEGIWAKIGPQYPEKKELDQDKDSIETEKDQSSIQDHPDPERASTNSTDLNQ